MNDLNKKKKKREGIFFVGFVKYIYEYIFDLVQIRKVVMFF